MRAFEIVLITLTLADGTGRILLADRRPLWVGVLPLLAFLFAIIHLAGEGARWQMIPVYAIVAATFVSALIRAFRTGDLLVTGERLSRASGIASIALTIAALVAGTALPVYELPVPTGDYTVGTRDIRFDDGTGVRVYYPADQPQGIRSAFDETDLSRYQVYLASRYAIPEVLLGHLSVIRTHAYPEIPLSAELPRYRVLIQQPEPGRPAVSTLGLVQDLASHGFVVLTSGSFAEEDTTSAASLDPESLSERIESLDPDGQAGWLADRLDMARVGVFGFGSAGGTVVDASKGGTFRAGAVIGSDSRSTDPVVPFLYLRPEEVQDSPLTDVNATTYVISIRGMQADNFSDDAYVSPLMPTLGGFGSIDPERASRITWTYLNAFFNKHLTRGTVEPVLDGPHAGFPEVSIHIHDAEPESED